MTGRAHVLATLEEAAKSCRATGVAARRALSGSVLSAGAPGLARYVLTTACAFFFAAGGFPAWTGGAAARDDDSSTMVIAGQSFSCRDARGATVRTMQVTNLGDVGRAGIVNRVPVIVIDPHIIERLPDKLQIFFFQHECGHHALGHWFGGNSEQEKEADCWAIKLGRDNGTFSRDDVMSFAPFLAASGGSPFGHLPGPQRSKFLLRCFDEPGDRWSPSTRAAAP